ncbi:MAG TPA: tautomerase family protein [Solirubrobacteraceae bacterium]|jgi:phenylpyruvate tautomerase PptA (4-oxalocrotonate tautomerase family)|nr:tautomerase family protein [Solirubrobacteraceae bacterium]
MALVRIEVLEGRSAQEKRQLLDAVRESLVVALQVPRGDPTLRVLEHDPANVELPTAPHPVGDRYTLIEVTMFSGRSSEAKRTLYREIVRRLGDLGIPGGDITIVLVESPRENWGVHSGRPASEVELGFVVEV